MVSEVKKEEFREYVLKEKKRDLETMILTPAWIINMRLTSSAAGTHFFPIKHTAQGRAGEGGHLIIHSVLSKRKCFDFHTPPPQNHGNAGLGSTQEIIEVNPPLHLTYKEANIP